jgi:hypothetical protein
VNAPEAELRSTTRVVPPVQPRKLAKVPFVELADGRLQGVVSSGSDVERVYVSSIVAGTHTYYCSTNNNRPCGGLRNLPCNHLRLLVAEAEVQYGYERIASYLGFDLVEVPTTNDLMSRLAAPEPSAAATVFSRFLHHLGYLELPDSVEPIPELDWFPAYGAVR